MNYVAIALTGEPVASLSFNGRIVKLNSLVKILFKFVKFSTIKMLKFYSNLLSFLQSKYYFLIKYDGR